MFYEAARVVPERKDGAVSRFWNLRDLNVPLPKVISRLRGLRELGGRGGGWRIASSLACQTSITTIPFLCSLHYKKGPPAHSFTRAATKRSNLPFFLPPTSPPHHSNPIHHQGTTSFPSQSQHLPLAPSPPTPFKTSTNLPATHSASNNFPSFTFPQNASLNPVFTVPGCNPTHTAFSPLVLCKWRSNVFTIWLTAALDARYEYQPPRPLLSLMEPTRADMRARVACGGSGADGKEGRREDFRGRKGERCLMRSNGPRALTLKVSSAAS